MKSIDANKNMTHWPDVNHKVGETDFDENDLLAVFDAAGGLIGSARLSRPTYVQGRISRPTAAAVYNAWRNRTVFIYRNKTPGWIPYLGLAVDDGYRDAPERKDRVFIDMHKQEATNGCIFIVDPATPTDIDSSELRTFEPKLIKAILAAKGLDEAKVTGNAVTLGVMRVIDITL